MKFIVPTAIGEAQMVSSSVPESQYDEWNASVTYPAGQFVSRSATHSVYKRVTLGSGAEPPENDAVNWTRIGPTNRWACLDNVVGTNTAVTGATATDPVSMTYTIKPGQVRGIALLDMVAEAAIISISSAGKLVYEKRLDPLGQSEDVDNYYDYFFSSIVRRTIFVRTDVPPYPDCEVTVILRNRGTVSLGSLIVGDVFQVGEVLSGVSGGILDFSRKERDEFGGIQFTERGYARKMTLPLLIKSSAVDTAALRLARFRAKPVVWIGSPTRDSMTIYGICRDWSVIIPGPNVSTMSVEIEGLV